MVCEFLVARETWTSGSSVGSDFGSTHFSVEFDVLFCTLLLTFAKVMILRWVGVVMPGDQTQMPLLHGADMDVDGDNVIWGVLVEKKIIF